MAIFLSIYLQAASATTINVYVDLDRDEGETTWTLTGPGGFLQSGGPYSSVDDIINLDFTVTTSGTYIFTINDSSGDGMADSGGGSNENGLAGYRIQVDGITQYLSANLPNFGSQDVRIFSVTATDTCDPVASGNQDTDADNVSDICDLDDDNDGLPDEDEGTFEVACPTIGSIEFPSYDYSNCSDITGGKLFTNIGTFQGNAIDMQLLYSGPGFVSCGTTPGLGCTTQDDGFTLENTQNTTAVDFSFFLSGTSTPISINWAVYLDDFDSVEGFRVDKNDLLSYVLNANNGTVVVEDPVYLSFYSNDDNEDDISLSFFDVRTVTIEFDNDNPFGTRDYCFNSLAGSIPDNPSCTIYQLASIDTDGDGIANALDLDSDNDGIYDLHEAGHALADIDADGRIDGAAGTSGPNGLYNSIETSAESGVINFTIADSEISPDGTMDANELDSDGDTCLDAAEEGVSDIDSDGIAGSGIPTVNADGLVTTITYGAPINNNWQNPNVGPCLPEVCNNGIDDDTDGLIDCADPYCSDDGNADVVFSSIGTDDPDEALGPPDGVGAQLYENGDLLALDLTSLILIGETYTLTWRRGSAVGSDPKVIVEESVDGLSFTTANGSPFTITTISYVEQSINTSIDVRYVRITKDNNFDLDVDAVSYTSSCPEYCPTATMNPHVLYHRPSGH